MTSPQTNIKTQLTELVSNAFEAFCNDIAGMFGVDMDSRLSEGTGQTVKGIQKHFKKLSAVITIRARGTLGGHFYLLYDREALFTLAGTIVMLPEERIKSTRKTGSLQDAQELQDAVGETGNLLVGSWDRIFREELEGHEHLLQTNTFIGNPWDDVAGCFGLSEDEEFHYFPCEMTVGSFGAFNCGVIFPEAIFNPAPETLQEPEQAQDAQTSEQAPPPETPPSNDSAAGSETNDDCDVQESPNPAEKIAEESVETGEVDAGDSPIAEQAETDQSSLPENDEPDSKDEQTLEPVPDSGGSVSQTIQQMAQSLPILPKEQAQQLLGVPAKDIMNSHILWSGPDDSVQQTLEKMQQANAACTLVGGPDKLEGIVTSIDIAEAISIYLRPVFSKWRRPADDATLHIKIKVIMTRPVRTIHLKTPLSSIMEDMCRHRIRCLPVVDSQGRVQGVVTGTDVFKALLRSDTDFSVASQKP